MMHPLQFHCARTLQRGLLLLVSLLLLPCIAIAEPASEFELPPKLRGVGFDQKLNAQIPLELQFKDSNGRDVRLKEYFGSQPVILVLAYYQCPRLCNMVLNGLVQGMLEMPQSAGDDYQVVVVSFDPMEDWRLAAAKKHSYMKRYARPGGERGWHFLTGTQSNIKPLADSVGFRYRYDDEQKQYIHASGIVILTPTGKVSRYFYDLDYPGRDLRLGLVEASNNKIGSPVDQLLLFCFHYDASIGKYTASIMNIVRVFGVATLFAIGAFVYYLSRSSANKEGGAPADSIAAPVREGHR